MITYLYVKTHNKTGLKYLGITKSVDPHKYTGSGLYWLRHLKKHGNDYTTEILKECEHPAMVKFWGEHYSKLWNIVESDDWANMRIESGDGIDPEFASKNNKKRIKNGTHLFLNGEFHRKNNLKRLSNGTHNMLDGKLVRKQLEDGTHPSQIKWTCEHCGKIGKGSTNYKRWHGDKCTKR